FGLGGSVTAGIVSARQRDINSGPYDDFLQTDAAINRGNSGGPMFDMNGTVIGINTAIYSPTGVSIGIGFAIPSNIAKAIVTELQVTVGKLDETEQVAAQEPPKNKQPSKADSSTVTTLGLTLSNITPELKEKFSLSDQKGVVVVDVTKDGPAAEKGLKPGDVI